MWKTVWILSCVSIVGMLMVPELGFSMVENVYSVPEPATFLLLAVGIAGLGVAAMKRRKKDADK